MNPLQLFHTSPSSTYDQKVKSERHEHNGSFPRQLTHFQVLVKKTLRFDEYLCLNFDIDC